MSQERAKAELEAGRPRPTPEIAIPSLYPPHVPPHQAHPTGEDFAVLDRPRIGRAVVALRPFLAGVCMARFDGMTVGYVTQLSLQKSPRPHLVDPVFAGLLAHACTPNAALDMERQNLHALRAIAAGEILTIDYEATEDELFAPFACGCAADACRGTIRGRKLRERLIIAG